MSRRTDPLTKDQIASYREAFKIFDVNGDGTISLKELGSVLKASGQKVDEEELKAMMEVADKDKDGVDFDDFLKMMEGTEIHAAHEEWSEADLKKAFDQFDTDNSGCISMDELKAVVANLSAEAVAEADTNKDGVLDNEEMQAMFDAVDVNKDGKIEFKEFVKMMTGGE